MIREGFVLRASQTDDRSALGKLYPSAFPDEDLLPLVGDLLDDTHPVLSLVAVADRTVVGHVVLTECTVSDSPARVALLGPLAVTPQWQRQGIGSALIGQGIAQQIDLGVQRILVLGDPAYYGRFGFRAEAAIEPPYPLPAEWTPAWQGFAANSTTPLPRGTLRVPRAWQRHALWAP